MNELFLKIINMSISASWLILAVLMLRLVLKKEIYAEQWIDGTCVQSAPVVMTQYVESIGISMREHREEGASVGTDIQIETDQYGGSLLTHFAHPENLNITGWAFEGYKLDEKNKLSPDKEVILAAKVFDNGSGVRVFDCETLVNEPERLENAAYMIVVRAVFSADPLGVTEAISEYGSSESVNGYPACKSLYEPTPIEQLDENVKFPCIKTGCEKRNGA